MNNDLSNFFSEVSPVRVKNQTMTPAFRGLSLFCFLISMSFSQLSFSGVYGEGTWGTMTYEAITVDSASSPVDSTSGGGDAL